MSDEHVRTAILISRRGFLSIASATGSAVIAVGLVDPASAAPKKKFTQQQAHYQPIPKSGQRCQNCSLWQSPTSCQVVEGQVSPAGWCILYQAKA